MKNRGTLTTLPRCLAWMAILLVSRASAAQTPAQQPPAASLQVAPTPQAVAPAAAPAPAPAVALNDVDVNGTRRRLEEILRQYPPTVGQVLALDPGLISSQGYLAAYPMLAAFVAQHPEVARDPGYFFGQNLRRMGMWEQTDARTESARAIRDLMQGLTIAMTMSILAVFVAWLARTLIDHRRWLRVSRMQTETHAKLLDRLTSSEELLAFLETPAGRRFLEGAPLPAQAQAPSAPLNRILWSITVGVVLLFGGFGLDFVSSRVLAEIREPLFIFGVVAMALGAGFVTSAALSYGLSRRLGLLDTQNSHA